MTWSERDHHQTYVFVEGTDRLSLEWVEVLEGAGGEADDEVKLVGAASEEVKVVAHWHRGVLVHPLVHRMLQLRDLQRRGRGQDSTQH